VRQSAEAVIIGGGVIGCAVAYHLTRAGIRPVLLERDGLAIGASGANAGGIGASSGIPGRTLSYMRKSLELLVTDVRELDRPVEMVLGGRLHVALDSRERAAMEEFVKVRQHEGMDITFLTGDDARALEPALGPAVLGAAHVPSEGHINPFLLTHAYAAAAQQRGAEVVLGVEATGLQVSGGRITGVQARGDSISTPLAILAAGAWSASLLAPLRVVLPVKPGRGQMLVTVAVPPLMMKHVIRPGGLGIRQAIRGNILIGSTLEDVGYDKGLKISTLASFARAASEMIPALEDVPIVRAWAGLRPMTPDRVGIIDTLPDLPGLILATGHSRTGVTYAPITGVLVTQLATKGTTDMPLDPFRLSRFSAGGAQQPASREASRRIRA
jgi:glycine/D-amino acid oxidase-like deaminating enzyme